MSPVLQRRFWRVRKTGNRVTAMTALEIQAALVRARRGGGRHERGTRQRTVAYPPSAKLSVAGVGRSSRRQRNVVIMLDAHLADGSMISFEADSVTTAQEVVDMVLHKKSISDRTGYTVNVICDGRGAHRRTADRCGRAIGD